MASSHEISGHGQPRPLPRATPNHSASRNDRAADGQPVDREGPLASSPKVNSSNDRVTAKDVLRQVASHAMQYPPPPDMAVLRASASKFLLTSLEPARELAEQIRADLHAARDEATEALDPPADRERAARLLAPLPAPTEPERHDGGSSADDGNTDADAA